MEGELRPRLCFLTKGGRGYGFHLHGERNKGGQFIRKVEPGSSADMGGLRPGDRVVEVNGENVEVEPHYQVSYWNKIRPKIRLEQEGIIDSVPVRQLSLP